MKCNKCGASITKNMIYCPECGNKTKIKTKKIINLVVISALIFVLTIFIYIWLKPKRKEILMSLPQNNYYKFTINNQEYFLGQKVLDLKKTLNFEQNFTDIVYSDSISIRSFFNNDEEQFLGAVYCASENNCKHDDSVLVKVNFFENAFVTVNDFIKRGVTYEKIVEKYGKESGTFYQDKNILVWSFGNKIGDPYYLLKFNNYFNKAIIDIRIGVWWYDEEYEQTVITNKENR